MLLSSFFSAFFHSCHCYHIIKMSFVALMDFVRVQYEFLDIMQYVEWLSYVVLLTIWGPETLLHSIALIMLDLLL